MFNKLLMTIGIVITSLLFSCTVTQKRTPPVNNQKQQRASSSSRATILAETKPGGKLDFFTPIKGHEYDGVQIKPGVYSTLGHAAFYKWGKAVRGLGITDLEEAYAIFAEFKGQPISSRDKEYIKSGFLNE
ncbi:hypothetical protein [Hymenobacter pini]|uniref:hypothetical protein n=1 Tax=Hymenobacter pini TaxID=2880879 RepID=UPI001CF0EA63|nr:hypothetical protein [Hymenobacter pini]MCA8830625.1 hypothetical protein [Hymenobacter pini]